MNEVIGFRWLLRGFLLTALVLTVVFYPRIGRTQTGGNVAEQTLQEADTSEGRTDDPLGRRYIAIEEPAQSVSNVDLLETGDEQATGLSDDPQGRQRVPLEDAAPGSNLDAGSEAAPSEAALSSETAAQREAVLQSEAAYRSPLVVPAADFTDDGSNPDSLFFTFGGGYLTGDSENYGCVVAPVYLPAGVTVTDMFVSVYDNDGVYNLTIDLRRVDNFAGGTASMANAATAGTFAGLQTISDASIANPVVLYPDYSYYLTTCLLSSNLRLYSARLYYTTP